MKKGTTIQLSKAQRKSIEARKNAYALHMQGKTQDAIELLKKTSDYEENLVIRSMTAELMLHERKVREAYAEVKAILLKDKKHLQATKSLCHIYIKTYNLEKLFPLTYNLVLRLPEDPESNSLHSTSCHLKGDYPNAVAYARKAINFKLQKNAKPTPQPSSKKESFNKGSTLELLWNTLAQLARNGVHAFPAFGTLLGLVREGGLIEFDKDLDIGIPHSEMRRAHHCMLKNGWIEVQNSHYLSNPRAFYHKDSGISMDISGFIIDAETGKPATGIWRPGTPKDWNWIASFSNLDLVKQDATNGEECWFIKEPELWLTEIYGDWRTPNPNFDTLISAKNMTSFSLIAQSYAFSRIYNNIEKGNNSRALAMIESVLEKSPNDFLMIEAQKKILSQSN